MSPSSGNLCQYIEIGQSLPGGFRRNYWIHVTQFPEVREKLGNRGLYTSIYRYSDPDPHAPLIWGPLYFDFDGEWEQVRKDVIHTLSYLRIVWRLDYNEMRIFFSGRRGCHVIVPAVILGIDPKPDLHNYYRSIAMDLKNHIQAKTLDTQIYDRRRLFRVPNSLHQETGFYKIPLLPEEVARLSYEQIVKIARQPRQIRRPELRVNPQAQAVFQRYVPKEPEIGRERGVPEIDFDPPCVTYLLENGAQIGQRNISCAALANHLQRRGLSEEETLNTLLEWNTRNGPPLPEMEVRNTVRSIYRHLYAYGCSTFEQVSQCSQDCPIYQRR